MTQSSGKEVKILRSPRCCDADDPINTTDDVLETDNREGIEKSDAKPEDRPELTYTSSFGGKWVASASTSPDSAGRCCPLMTTNSPGTLVWMHPILFGGMDI